MATIPVKLMYDENNNPFVPLISLDSIEDIQGTSVQDMLDAKLEATNIIAGNQIELEIDGNNITINNAASGMNIIDNLETEESGLGSLDAHQGKILKDSIPEIVNNLNTIDSTKALSAHQGYVLAGRSVPVGGASGQVLKKTNDNDYALEWGDAADPNAIGGDGTIKKIVELSYQDYLDLKDNEQLDETTEYHINDWTESGLIEVKAEQVIMSDGFDVEEVIRDDQGHIVNLSNRMDTVEYRLENKDIVDEGQNTRLDVAEGNIDAIVNTVNSHASTLSTLVAQDVSAAVTPTDTSVAGLGNHSRLIKCGPVYAYQMNFTTGTALSANVSYTLGRISESHRPNTNSSLQGYIRANNDLIVSFWITSDGYIQIYPTTTIATNANLAGNFSWIRL